METQAPATASPRPPPNRRAPRNGGSNTFWILMTGLFLGAGAGMTCVTCVNTSAEEHYVFGDSNEKIGVVELLGPIEDATKIIRQIRRFSDRDDLKALVIRIDSPGGAVAPSQEIYNALRYAAKSKPVVASMGNVAASGGFWVSLGADWVLASPGTVTGSIGVITQLPDLRGLAALLKFKMHTFKSGPLKDAGNPLREMNDADQNLFRSLIEDIYEQFVARTAERRNLSAETVRRVADGRILTGRAALKVGLVDELGDLHDAAKRARDLWEVRDGTKTSTGSLESIEPPSLVYPEEQRPSFLELLSQGAAQGIADGIMKSVSHLSSGAMSNPLQLR